MAKIEVKCTEPGCTNTRLVQSAVAFMVTRCKECQKEKNRESVRLSYLKRKGLPADTPRKEKQEKTKEPEVVESPEPEVAIPVGPTYRTWESQEDRAAFIDKFHLKVFGRPLDAADNDW